MSVSSGQPVQESWSNAQAFEALGWGHELQEIVHFHNLTRRALGALYRELMMQLNEADGSSDVVLFRHNAYLMKHFAAQIQNTTFLLMYSLVESWLEIARNYFLPSTRKTERSSLERFSPFLKKINFDLQCSDWIALKEAKDLRDCVLHANSKVVLCKGPLRSRLENLAKRKTHPIEIKDGAIEIGSAYLLGFRQTVESFCRKVGTLATSAVASDVD